MDIIQSTQIFITIHLAIKLNVRNTLTDNICGKNNSCLTTWLLNSTYLLTSIQYEPLTWCRLISLLRELRQHLAKIPRLIVEISLTNFCMYGELRFTCIFVC